MIKAASRRKITDHKLQTWVPPVSGSSQASTTRWFLILDTLAVFWRAWSRRGLWVEAATMHGCIETLFPHTLNLLPWQNQTGMTREPDGLQKNPDAIKLKEEQAMKKWKMQAGS